jgi:ubiquinone/menaquinone biosynthesis C-methylase UbiE
MRILTKKKNHLSEEHFHDKWARTTSVGKIDVLSQFEGVTSPEYKEVITSLGNIKGKKILNLGSGLGEEAVYLALKEAKVTAIDISTHMLIATRKLAKKYKVEKKISYRVMDAEKLKFKKNTFDAIVGCNILHHVNIRKTIKEARRVLKPKGVAVFSEPLVYNPIINVYRIIADKVRTDHEHPLDYSDLNTIRKTFPNVKHKEFQLFTLLLFVYFYFIKKVHPNKERYWKKIITEAYKYKYFFKFFYFIDMIVLKILPFLKRYCWVTVIRVTK